MGTYEGLKAAQAEMREQEEREFREGHGYHAALLKYGTTEAIGEERERLIRILKELDESFVAFRQGIASRQQQIWANNVQTSVAIGRLITDAKTKGKDVDALSRMHAQTQEFSPAQQLYMDKNFHKIEDQNGQKTWVEMVGDQRTAGVGKLDEALRGWKPKSNDRGVQVQELANIMEAAFKHTTNPYTAYLASLHNRNTSDAAVKNLVKTNQFITVHGMMMDRAFLKNVPRDMVKEAADKAIVRVYADKELPSVVAAQELAARTEVEDLRVKNERQQQILDKMAEDDPDVTTTAEFKQIQSDLKNQRIADPEKMARELATEYPSAQSKEQYDHTVTLIQMIDSGDPLAHKKMQMVSTPGFSEWANVVGASQAFATANKNPQAVTELALFTAALKQNNPDIDADELRMASRMFMSSMDKRGIVKVEKGFFGFRGYDHYTKKLGKALGFTDEDAFKANEAIERYWDTPLAQKKQAVAQMVFKPTGIPTTPVTTPVTPPTPAPVSEPIAEAAPPPAPAPAPVSTPETPAIPEPPVIPPPAAGYDPDELQYLSADEPVAMTVPMADGTDRELMLFNLPLKEEYGGGYLPVGWDPNNKEDTYALRQGRFVKVPVSTLDDMEVPEGEPVPPLPTRDDQPAQPAQPTGSQYYYPLAAPNVLNDPKWKGNYLQQRKSRKHAGIDFSATRASGGMGKTGIPVVAPVGGTLIQREHNSSSFGNFVSILGDDGRIHRLGHMDKHNPSLKRGQRVEGGSYLGNMGSTGQSNAPHMHYEVRENADGSPITMEQFKDRNYTYRQGGGTNYSDERKFKHVDPVPFMTGSIETRMPQHDYSGVKWEPVPAGQQAAPAPATPNIGFKKPEKEPEINFGYSPSSSEQHLAELSSKRDRGEHVSDTEMMDAMDWVVLQDSNPNATLDDVISNRSDEELAESITFGQDPARTQQVQQPKGQALATKQAGMTDAQRHLDDVMNNPDSTETEIDDAMEWVSQEDEGYETDLHQIRKDRENRESENLPGAHN